MPHQAALAVLKPTAKQLAHGLDLHAASLVFESYGFSPRAAWDGDALRKAIEAGASPIELEDLREEMTMTCAGTDAAERAEYLAAWKAAGVTCIFQNAGEETQDPMRLVKRLARFTYVTDRLRDYVTRAVTPEDVVAARKQGKHCLYFSGNGVPLAQKWESLEDELSYIRVFYQLGIRMMHMTYNRRNMLGDGCAEPANAGLSDFGKAAVAEMNRVGVIADVAHSGWQTSLGDGQGVVTPGGRQPLGLRRAAPSHPLQARPRDQGRRRHRRLHRHLLCAGVLGGPGDIRAMLDHLDYAVRRFGAEHVAIGTDVAYTSRNMAAESKKVPKTGATRPRWESFWPPGSLDFGGEPLSLAWTNWPLFTVGMVQRGYSDDDIRKVLGGNVMRVARAALA